MMPYQCHLDPKDLQTHVKNIFGTEYVVANIENMHGGAQKAVYKVNCMNQFSFVLYVWDITINYFQQEIEKEQRSEHHYSSQLFVQNYTFLHEVGIRVPYLYYVNQDRLRYSFDFAFVEYIDAQPSDAFFQADRMTQHNIFTKTNDMLAAMHANTSCTYGKLHELGNNNEPCYASIMKNAQLQLDFAAQHIAHIAEHQTQLLDTLSTLESRIEPRQQYHFIHGELGPNHIFIDQQLEPCLIDIDGAMFFDIEFEHSFMAFRFDKLYPYFKNNALDRNRMLFYKMHHHISYAAGGLKLLHRNFPDRQLAESIVSFNSQCVLAFLAGTDNMRF
ncbi:phosphotransferase [Paenibacillus sp. SC116]|uniref:phosphotransferase n=1 Tax=Paenibacillus sp. SC116 TaxID=2968986 RepID=UPI00215AC980|nr:phosphotransferase [Paenibacillus sp. SC116]MCR8844286.1 phosphotransferase [Paenibacillus sp. SC116]